jgi:hypothetical protein
MKIAILVKLNDDYDFYIISPIQMKLASNLYFKGHYISMTVSLIFTLLMEYPRSIEGQWGLVLILANIDIYMPIGSVLSLSILSSGFEVL